MNILLIKVLPIRVLIKKLYYTQLKLDKKNKTFTYHHFHIPKIPMYLWTTCDKISSILFITLLFFIKIIFVEDVDVIISKMLIFNIFFGNYFNI